jgi:hypothetical protein
VKLAVKPPWDPHLDFRREGTLVVHLHRRRSGRLPPGSHGAGFLDRNGHLTRPGMVERKRQREGLSLVERLGKAEQHDVRASRAQRDGLSGRDVQAASGRILMTPPSIDIVCSSAFLAIGDDAAVRRSAVGETIVK